MFTREIYDRSTFANDVHQLKGPGKYQLLPESTYLNPGTCFQVPPEMHGSANIDHSQYKISLPNDMVNIESDLYNLNRPNTKDPLRKYPYIKPDYGNPPIIPVCTSTEMYIQRPTLEGNQFNREKSIAIPRFESLCLNPQQYNRIRSNNVIGLDTRLFNRDIHKPKIPLVHDHNNIFNGAESNPLKLTATDIINNNENNAVMAQENYNNLVNKSNQNYYMKHKQKKYMKPSQYIHNTFQNGNKMNYMPKKKPYMPPKNMSKQVNMMPKNENFCSVCG